MSVSREELVARVSLAKVLEPMDRKLSRYLIGVAAPLAWELVRSGDGPFARCAARAESVDIDRTIEVSARLGTRIVCPGDPEWPSGLDDLPVPPWCLWAWGTGHLADLTTRCVAVVGSRNATSYGRQVAGDLAQDLAVRNILTVSGAAFGIDAAAHRGALSVGVPTVAALACGLDRAYPAAHRELLASIARGGVVVSELPPGCSPQKQRFLARNRLIAAMTAGTVVVEAGLRSGSLNTAHHALGLGRDVAAVPGPITSAMSAGVNKLIRDGKAVLVTDADEVAELVARIGEELAPDKRAPETEIDDLPEDTRRVLTAMPVRRATTVDRLTQAAGMSVPEILSALAQLQVRSMVDHDDRGWFRTNDLPL